MLKVKIIQEPHPTQLINNQVKVIDKMAEYNEKAIKKHSIKVIKKGLPPKCEIDKTLLHIKNEYREKSETRPSSGESNEYSPFNKVESVEKTYILQ